MLFALLADAGLCGLSGCCPSSGGGRRVCGAQGWARHCGNPPALNRRLAIPLVWGLKGGPWERVPTWLELGGLVDSLAGLPALDLQGDFCSSSVFSLDQIFSNDC